MGSMIVDFVVTNIASLFCIATMVVFFIVDKEKNDKVQKYFYIFTALVFFEVVRSYLDAVSSGMTKFYLASIGYILRPLLIYLIAMTMMRDWPRRTGLLMGIPLLLDVILLVFGRWMGGAVYTFYDHNFEWGPLIDVVKYSIVYFLFILILVAFLVCKKSKWEAIIVWTCCFFIILNYINEVIFNFSATPFQNIAISFSAFTYYMYFCTQKHYVQIVEKDDEIETTKIQISMEMVDQAIETLAYTIDAKDSYTRGHSVRVAKYSKMIAERMGKNVEECREIYLAGLLHDIGKIAVPAEIINKVGRLTDDEYEEIKKHPANGAKILEKMKSIPYLQDGAKYHHERYDGHGYPTGLSGEDIPEAARIIAVADAYDAMTSYRSYRDVMDQSLARQEIWKGVGSQFDPYFAKIMVSMIDSDLPYAMREQKDVEDEVLIDEANSISEARAEWGEASVMQDESVRMQSTDIQFFGEFIKSVDNWASPLGMSPVTRESKKYVLFSKSADYTNRIWQVPCIILYHAEDGEVAGKGYEELSIVKCTGYGWRVPPAIKDMEIVTKKPEFTNWDDWFRCCKDGMEHFLTISQKKNVIHATLEDSFLQVDLELILPEDYGKQVYFAFSGDNCMNEGFREVKS